MPFMPVMTKKKPPDGLGAREKFFSGYVRLSAARLAQAIPSPARGAIVKVPWRDRRMLALVPDRQLSARSVDVVIEHHQHAFGQLPAQRGHLIIDGDSVIFELRLTRHR